jgi:hypothetical protein
MEEGFLLTKEMGLSWNAMTMMPSRERNWLLDRLARFFEESAAAQENADSGSGGKGNLGVG